MMMKLKFKNLLLLFVMVALAASCGDDDDNGPDLSDPDDADMESVEITDETEELEGAMYGTLTEGTYKLVGDLYILEGEEIVMEPGVRIESTAGGIDVGESHSIFVNGSFYSLGTENNPNWITTVPENRSKANFLKGYLGTIEGRPSAENMVFKWTHIEFGGGPSGPGSNLYDEGETMKTIRTQSFDTKLIVEDSWFFGTTDDAIRPDGAKIAILRNTFESIGGIEGEILNAKNSVQGDFAYNMIIGHGTNGPKTGGSSSGPSSGDVTTDINVYNNTIVGGGFRRVADGRGGSMNIERQARGYWYNNLVVNCRYGMRVVDDTDYDNTYIGYTHYYGNDVFNNDEGDLSNNFYPEHGTIVRDWDAGHNPSNPFPTDHIEGDNLDNVDPEFVDAKIDFMQADYRNVHEGTTHEPLDLNRVGDQDFRLDPNSPLVGAGSATAFNPVNSITTIGDKGLSAPVPGPSDDIGCYPSNNNGNQHFTHDYYPSN